LLLFLGILACFLLAHNLYAFLAPNEPVGARVLVVEGWLAPDELDQAVQFFKKGKYEHIVTTGGPISGWPELFLDTDYARIAADYLTLHGVSRDIIIVVPTPKSAQERTFLSAVMVRKSAKQLGLTLDAIDLFSSGPHARRSRLLYQMALGRNVRVGILAARPGGFDPEDWWQTSAGVEAMAFQSVGYAWVTCCFWTGTPGSQKELWADLPAMIGRKQPQ
jgi:hypothetical protein